MLQANLRAAAAPCLAQPALCLQSWCSISVWQDGHRLPGHHLPSAMLGGGDTHPGENQGSTSEELAAQVWGGEKEHKGCLEGG